MCGNEKMCIQTKGALSDDSAANLTVEVTCDADRQWKPSIHLQKRAKDFIWWTPPCPDLPAERVDAMIRIQYKGKNIHEAKFTYLRCLDSTWNDACPTDILTNLFLGELNTNCSGGLTMSNTTGAPSVGGPVPVTHTTRQAVKRSRR